MNAVDFENFDPAVKGESVKKRLADGWMIVHTYTGKVPITHQGPTVWTEELLVAM